MAKPSKSAESGDQSHGAGHGKDKLHHADTVMVMIERLVLTLVVALTLIAIAQEVMGAISREAVRIADILLLFLYAEILAMVRVYFLRNREIYIYPVLIAITALSRLIVLQGKEMNPISILYESLSILILVIAIMLMRKLDLGALTSTGAARKAER